MSKKTSKILVIAVVCLLAVSMMALVACGGGGDTPAAGGGNKPSKEVLPEDPFTADMGMTELQTNFDSAHGKVHEVITVGGLDVKVGADPEDPKSEGLCRIKINNVTVDMTRQYKSNGDLVIAATIKDLNVQVIGLTDILDMVGTISASVAAKLNIDDTTIANLSKVKIDVKCTIDKEMKVTLNDFVIWNLNEVKNAKKEQLKVLTDGSGALLGKEYRPGELPIGQVTDPYHQKDPSDPSDKDGIFTALDDLSVDFGQGDAGAKLKKFLQDKYSMLSLYEFDSIEVSGDLGQNISGTAKSGFPAVYAQANKILNDLRSKEFTIPENKDKETPEYHFTIGGILSSLLGNENATLENVLTALGVTMGNATMTGTLTGDAEGTMWLPKKITNTQNISVNIPGATLQSAVNNVLPMFGININDLGLPGPVVGIIDNVLKGGLKSETPIKVVTSAEFTY